MERINKTIYFKYFHSHPGCLFIISHVEIKIMCSSFKYVFSIPSYYRYLSKIYSAALIYNLLMMRSQMLDKSL